MVALPATDPTEICRRLEPAVRAFAWRRLRRREAVDSFVFEVLGRLAAALLDGGVADAAAAGALALGLCRAHAAPRGTLGLGPEPPPRELPRLEAALARLSGRTRDVLRAAVVDAASNRAIAEQLSLSESTVRVVRQRGLTALRQSLLEP